MHGGDPRCRAVRRSAGRSSGSLSGNGCRYPAGGGWSPTSARRCWVGCRRSCPAVLQAHETTAGRRNGVPAAVPPDRYLHDHNYRSVESRGQDLSVPSQRRDADPAVPGEGVSTNSAGRSAVSYLGPRCFAVFTISWFSVLDAKPVADRFRTSRERTLCPAGYFPRRLGMAPRKGSGAR